MDTEQGVVTSDVFGNVELARELADYLEARLSLRSCQEQRDRCKKLIIEIFLAREFTDEDDGQLADEIINELEEAINETSTNEYLVFSSFGDGNNTYGWMVNESVIETEFYPKDCLKLWDDRLVNEHGHILEINDHGNMTIRTVDGATLVEAV